MDKEVTEIQRDLQTYLPNYLETNFPRERGGLNMRLNKTEVLQR